ncbi:IS30 family, transposase [Sphingobium herbicidovorans NBRC 16415]|uniref:IS30 family, transposase n=1 Tax=Sphingobium herbicidovorans (strain ATCC 700291 / DSM 11019 / CCUG 56400 / KCTC 2939 / LMG 18315 / NBRC 16415 / MH) TaxID=1219045 RepID=A0A086PBM2_SPHHM|nr:helix-turn-helix domain-containing protein [Sphingobium herbicidovorans]KFG90790.1 IS30 family, transposase [Sphingobium herbicidovorans NBRC 16415]
MNGYQHLGLDERRQIYQLAATARSVQQIAVALERHRSTIYREIKRNRHLDEEPIFRGHFPPPHKQWRDRCRVRGHKIALTCGDDLAPKQSCAADRAIILATLLRKPESTRA